MKIYLIFYVILLNHIASDFLLSQHQKFQELIIIKNDERFWYVNSILNFKHDKCYNSSLLKYYIDWKNHFFTWKSNWQRDSSVRDVDYESFDSILCLNRSQKSQKISIRRSSNDVRTLRDQKSHHAEFSFMRQHLF